MRFMMLYKPGQEATAPPSNELYAAVGKLIEEWTKEGVLVRTEGLQPSSRGARVQCREGKFTVAHGPFPEPKELIAGYAIVRVKSKEDAIDLAKDFLGVMGGGESEIREMHDGPHE